MRKSCSQCNELKDFSEFSSHRRCRNTDGRLNRCRKCSRQEYAPVEEFGDNSAAGWINKNWKDIFPSDFSLVEKEFGVYGTILKPSEMELFSAWRIDFYARHNSKPYIVECDINDSTRDAWHFFKLIGYRAAYCLDRGVSPNKIGMMALISDRVFNHRVRNIFIMSKIEFCVFSKSGDKWELIKSSLWG